MVTFTYISVQKHQSQAQTTDKGSRCVQYDVELTHHIEDLIGHQLAEYEMKESEVLKGITRVYAAKRAAKLRALEEESKEGSRQQLVKHKLAKRRRAPEQTV